MKRDVLIKVAKQKRDFWAVKGPTIGGVLGGLIGGGLGGNMTFKNLDNTGLTDDEIKRRRLKHILRHSLAGGVGGGIGGYAAGRLFNSDDLKKDTKAFKRRASKLKRGNNTTRDTRKTYNKPMDIGHLVNYTVYD